jgi:peptidoglycan/LPS O-acetylase OafA/YrhL
MPPAGDAAEDDDTGGGAVALSATPAETSARTPAPQAGPATGTGSGTDRGTDTGTGDAGGVGATRLPYLPGLDGLRAVALLAVLAFHHGYAWARGGFLGVSSFFTLSGFLIATLALGEWSATGRLAPARFWERRARRLLPAALVALAAIAVLQATLGIGSAPGFRGDLLAALGYAANWRAAATTGDYARLFSDPSPVAHLWSLAIEEQFYLLFPLLFPAVMLAVRHRRRPGAGTAAAGAAWAALAAASFASAWVLARGGDGNSGLVYYATFTRAGELVVGVVAAHVYVLARRARADRPHRAPAGDGRPTAGGTPGTPAADRVAPSLADAVGRAVPVAGALALAGLAVLWHATTLGTPGLFRGITAVNAGLTVLVVLATTTGGPVARALGWPPLRALGRISYGAYLYHWPVFLVLDAQRTHVGHPHWLFAARVGATVALAAASYRLIEAPVRFRLPLSRPRLAAASAGAVALVAVVVLVLPVGGGAPTGVGLDPDAEEMGWTVPAGAPDPVRVLLVGDSVAWSLGPSFRAWNDSDPPVGLAVEGYTPFGCPLGGLDVPVRINGQPWRRGGDCRTWHDNLVAIVARADADVIVFTSGVFEMGERQFAGDWYHLGDPVFDRWLEERLAGIADVLASKDVPVLWGTLPHLRMRDPADLSVPWDELDENDPARVDRLNELVLEVVADRPGVEIVDLGAWARDLPDGEFGEERADGVHVAWAGAAELAAWLGPQVTAAAGAAATDPAARP